MRTDQAGDPPSSGDDPVESRLDTLLREVARLPEASPPEPEPDRIGQQIAKYRVRSKLGEGGMGIVYAADDIVLGRTVALKVLPQALLKDEGRLFRFLREGRSASAVSDANIATVFDIGASEGTVYLAMEYVDGVTLRRRLAEQGGRLLPEDALRIVDEIARGVATAHRVGVVHRDLKPENIMIRRDGAVKVLDFGLAKLVDAPALSSGTGAAVIEDGLESHEGRIVGTLPYMSPEQLEGDRVDARTDIFSLGVMLFEMLTGKRPFRGTNPDEMRRSIANDVPLSAPGIADSIPAPVARLLRRCLDELPEKRFADGGELLAELARIRDGFPAGAHDRASARIPEGNPYVGLRPFDEGHRAVFFGRGTDIQDVVQRLRGAPLVVVAGDSGVGKSSLCRAGVCPRVAEGALGADRSFDVRVLVPGRRPVAALASELAPLLGTAEDALEQRLRREPESVARDLFAALGDSRGVLIFVDQIEEIFTLADPADAAAVDRSLAQLGMGFASVRVLLTVRYDFLTRLASLPRLGPDVRRGLHDLLPLSPEGTRAAITGPARWSGVAFESDALVETLVETHARTAGGLPLLQFALAELWKVRGSREDRITAAALEEIGGVGGALSRHANGVLAALPPEQRAAARRILPRLITAEGTRARCTAAEVGAEDAVGRAAIDALIEGRLVVTSGSGDETTYEIAHETLIQGWKELRDLCEADRDTRHVRERIADAAAEWVRLGRTDESLHGARQLAEVASVAPDMLAPQEAEFLAASRARLRRRRLLRWAAIVAAPVLALSALAGLRLKARADLNDAIRTHEVEGRRALALGRQKRTEADALRTRAYALFDAATGPAAEEKTHLADAERVWASALDTSRAAEDALADASRAFEAAFVFDPARAEIRAAVADSLVERILLAEQLHNDERRRDLLQRLANYDDGGTRRAQLAAPPELTIDSSPEGADVALERYDGEDGYRTITPAEPLGRTPIRGARIAAGPGSYRLTFRAPDRVIVRLPLLLARGQQRTVDVPLPATAAVPEGYVLIPRGRFLFGSADFEQLRKGLLDAPPIHEIETRAYLIGRTEVTFGDWLAFLKRLPPEERSKRRPVSHTNQGDLDLSEQPDGTWQLAMGSNGRIATAREGEPLRWPARSHRAAQRWERLPVQAVSLPDVQVYLAWLDHGGALRGARLCDEREWERAARGADERVFPHGNRLEPEDADFDQTYGRTPGAFGPDEVGSHPASDSPFGIADMAGNAAEWVRSSRVPGEGLFRGGAWYFDPPSAWIANRSVTEPELRDPTVGFRVCADAPDSVPSP